MNQTIELNNKLLWIYLQDNIMADNSLLANNLATSKRFGSREFAEQISQLEMEGKRLMDATLTIGGKNYIINSFRSVGFCRLPEFFEL